MERFLKLVFNIDSKGLEKGLDDAEKKSKKSAKSIQDSFKDAFQVIASSFVALKIKDFFSGAIQDAIKFETAMLKVAAAARISGNSVKEAQKNVTALAKDGQLTLEDSADIMKRLMSLGLSAKKAFDFAEQAKKVAAFEGTMGSTSESLQSFVKGLQTGSAELLENLSPSIQSAIIKLGGYAKVSQDAATRQKLLNIIIERGEKLTASYSEITNTGAAAVARFEQAQNNLSITLGKTILDSFKGALSGLSGLLEGFNSWLSGLSDGARQAVVLGGAITALIIPVGLALVKFKELAGGVSLIQKLFTMLAAHPLILAFTALSAAISITIAVYNQLNPSTDELIKKYNEAGDQVNAVKDSFAGLTLEQARAADSNSKMGKSYQDLINLSNKYNVSLTNEAGALRSVSDVLDEINRKRRQDIELRVRGLSVRLQELANQERTADEQLLFTRVRRAGEFREAGQISQAQAIERDLLQGIDVSRGINVAEISQQANQAVELAAEIRRLTVAIAPQTTTSTTDTTSTTGTTGQALKDNLFLLNEFGKKVRQINEDYKEQEKFIIQDSVRGSSEQIQRLAFNKERRLQLVDEAIIEERKKFNDLYNSELQEALAKNKEEFEDRIKQAENIRYAEEAIRLATGKSIEQIEIEHQERIAKTKENYLKKDFEAEIKNAQDKAESIKGIFSGLQGVITADSFGAGIGGAGQILGAFNPALGGIIGTAGEVVSIIENLFDDSEELKKQEEERKKQIELQNKLIENQVKLSQTLRNLEIERQKLIDKETEIELKKNALIYQDETQRRQADLSALQRLAVKQAQQAGLSTSDVQGAVNQINEIQRQKLSGEALKSAIGTLQLIPVGSSPNATRAILQSNLANISSVDLSNADPRWQSVKAYIQKTYSDSLTKLDVAESRVKESSTAYGRKAIAQGLLNNLIDKDFANIKFVSTGVENNLTELNNTLDRSSALLDTLKRIQDLNGSGGATLGGASLELRRQQAEQFINVARGGTVSRFGIFNAGIGAIARPQLSSGVSQVALAAQDMQKSFAERSATSLEESVKYLEKIFMQLVKINENTSQSGINIDTLFARVLSSIQQRII